MSSRSAPNTEIFNLIGNAIDFSAIVFNSNKKYTFYEPNWLYAIDTLKLLELLNPEYDVETSLLLAPQRDIVSGAVQDMQYWIDRKYVKWVPQGPVPATGPTSVIYDFSIVDSGNATYNIHLPMFDPTLGTLCGIRVNAVVNLAKVADFWVENTSASPITFSPAFTRVDTITGVLPVISENPTNTYTHSPVTITATDHVAGSGTDFFEGTNFPMMSNQVMFLLIQNTDLSPYIGDGFLDFTWIAASTFTARANTNQYSLFSNDVTFSIEYDYIPVINTIQEGFLPSLLDQNSLSLANIKVSENTFTAPKFVPIFFIVNNIKGKTDTVWTLTDITDPNNSQELITVRGAPYFIWRFQEIGKFSLTSTVSDNKGNTFTGTVDNLINVVERVDYIKLVESQLNSRKISLQNK